MNWENEYGDKVRSYLFHHKKHLDDVKSYNETNEIKETIPQLNVDATEPLAAILIEKGVLKDVYDEPIETIVRKGRNRKGGAKDLFVNEELHVEVKATYNWGGNSTFGKSNKESDVLIWIDGYSFFVENRSYLNVCVFPEVDRIQLSFVPGDNSDKSTLRNDRKSLFGTKYCFEFHSDIHTFKIARPVSKWFGPI